MGKGKGKDVKSLIEAISSSEVLENRISLIRQLGDLSLSGTSDLDLLVEWLITYWMDSTCLSISQCMLNKMTLHVATACLQSDASSCLSQFLILGTKANTWSTKHLQMLLMPTEKTRDEEHFDLFCQLLLDALRFSSTSITALTRTPILWEKVDMLIIENFISESLNLTKVSILEIKKIHSIALEVLKVAQVVLDAAIKLCRAYFQAVRSDINETNVYGNGGSVNCNGVDYASHVIRMIACTINNLYELGVFAASGGGNLVTILNASWKGVVCLLQLGKGALSEKVDAVDIIRALVSLATESLRCAAEAWSSALAASLSISEAKRTFLPIKFYLINAVRISSDYPCEALNASKEITRCVLLISSFGICLSKEAHLRNASEALTEFLEPTSFLLLHTLLNSADVRPESKSQILDWFFAYETTTASTCMEEVEPCPKASLNIIFLDNCDSLLKTEVLLVGRAILFLNLLKTSSVLREDMVLEISRKLDCLMDFFMHECIYSSILGLWVPVLSCSGQIPSVVWQPMFTFVLHALKTFMVVASALALAWIQVETFLLQNILHSHFLCLEIIRELLCFFIRHAEKDTVNHILGSSFMLLRTIAILEPSFKPLSAFRSMARSICVLLTSAETSTVDQVYNSVLSDESSYLSSQMYIALLMEGFPLDLLSESLNADATKKIVCSFYGFIENNSKELRLYASGSCPPGLIGLPVHALSSTLHSHQIKSSDIMDDKNTSHIWKFTNSLVDGYKNAKESMKDNYVKLLSAMLDIISGSKHLYGSEEIGEIILNLKPLFIVGSADSDSLLYKCKPSLARFMAGLCHMEIEESEGSALSSAIWSLYHVLLRERNWAFIHLALAAFGYFVARTNCTQLWRLVPHDSALSFDIPTGKEVNEDKFMSEVKGFLEKAAALREVTLCKEQLNFLFKEGIVLKKLYSVSNTSPGASEVGRKLSCTVPKVSFEALNDENCMRKKRKLPKGISEGTKLLQNGLNVISKAIEEADSSELNEAFSAHISSLEDVVSCFVGLANSM